MSDSIEKANVLLIDFDEHDKRIAINSISISTTNKRSKYNVEFLNVLNLLMKQKYQINCYLSSQWFKSEGGLKPRTGNPHWNGSYDCLHKDCNLKFKAKIEGSIANRTIFIVKITQIGLKIYFLVKNKYKNSY